MDRGPAGFLPARWAVLGFPTAALRTADELLANARRSSDSFALAYALFMSLIACSILRDGPLMRERSQELASIAAQQGLRGHMTTARFHRGLADALQGRAEEGIGEMRQALELERRRLCRDGSRGSRRRDTNSHAARQRSQHRCPEGI